MYIAEVTPGKVRGAFVSINQLTIVIGILAAQIINWRIARPVPEGASTAEILCIMEWSDRLALDVLCLYGSGRPVLHTNVARARKPPMAA